MANNQIKYQVSFDVQKQSLDQLKSSLQQIRKLGISDIVKINNTDINSARESLDNVRREANNVENALQKAFNTKLNTVNIQRFNQQLMSSGSSIKSIYDAFSRAGATGQSAFRNLTTSLLSTNIQLKETHNLLDKMATTLANTIKWNVASAAINGITRSAQQAWGFVKNLDTSLNDIRIVTGKSADEMANFAIKANEAAQSLGKSTTDYTNAALIYAQQGLSDKEIEERAKITLKTANVTGQSTSDVSEQLTAVWNGYKVNAEEAELYVDRLAAVAATTASDLEELSTGMSKVASAAAAMGVGEEQLAAQLSTIISATRQAPQSVGTALRTVYARISDIQAGIDEDGVTLGNYSGKMAELGFNVLDATGRLRDMGEVMQEIGGRWQSLTREQQINLAQTMAGQRQYNNLLALFDNFEKYNSALNTAQNAAGTLQKQQDTYMESTRAHIESLNASIERIYNSLADTDGINKLIDGLTNVTDLVGNFIDGIGGGIGLLRSLGAIGITVFSKQIGNSISTTIRNIQVARQQTKYFKDALAEAQNLKNLDLQDQYTKTLLNKQQDLLKIGGKLSVEDFNAIQKNLQQLSQTAGNIDILEEKIRVLSDTFDVLGLNIDEESARWGTLDDMLSSAQGVEVVKNKLTELKNKFDPIIQKQDELEKVYKSFLKSTNGKEFVTNFNNVRSQMRSLIEALKKEKISEETGKTLFDAIPKGAQESIDKVNKELGKLNFAENAEQTKNKITQIYGELNQSINTEIQNVTKAMEAADKGQLEGLQQQLEALRALQRQLEDKNASLLGKATSTINIQSITKAIGGVAQLGAAIQQVQNLGSIWKNQDLTTSQKLVQTFSNLAMVIPMVVSGLTSIAAVSPVLAVVAGVVTVAATAYSFYAKSIEEARQARIQSDKAQIESAKTKQKELEANKALEQSLKDLNDKYQDQQITRAQVKAQIESLIDQYHLEGQAADSLRNNYANLTEQILKSKKARAQEGAKNAQIQYTNAGLLAQQQLRKENENAYSFELTIPDELKDIFDGSQFVKEYSKLIPVIYDSDTIIPNEPLEEKGYKFTIENENGLTIEDLIPAYEAAQEELGQINDRIISDNFAELDADRKQAIVETKTQLQTFINAFKQIIEDYQQGQKLYQQNKAATDALMSSGQFLNIDNAFDYQQARAELIQKILNNNEILTQNQQQAVQLAEAALRNNFGEIYNQFNQTANYVDKLKDNFGQLPEQVKDLFNKIDSSKLDLIQNKLQLKNIDSWQRYKEIIEYISKTDFSNLQIVTDAVGQFENASNQYNVYSSLGEQVSNSKNKSISAKQFQELDSEIQSFFTITANGQYKLTGNAKEFYQTVNKFSTAGFEKNLQALNASNQRLKNLQNFDYNTLFSSPNSNAQLKLDYLTEAGYDTNAIAAWSTQLENGIDISKIMPEINEAIDKTGDQFGKLTERQKENESATYANQMAWASSANSLKQLQQLLNNKNISSEVFQQAAYNLQQTERWEDLDLQEVADYADYLQQLAKSTKDAYIGSQNLSRNIIDNTDVAEDLAIQILRMNKGVKDLADNWQDWSDILKNSSKGSDEYYKTSEKVKDTLADLLDTSADYISLDFVDSLVQNTENMELMQKAAEGDGEAIDQLRQLSLQDFIMHLRLDDSMISNESLMNRVTQIQNLLNTNVPQLKPGMDLTNIQIGEQSMIDALNEMIRDAGLTADQVNALLSKMGFQGNFASQPQDIVQTIQRTQKTHSVVDSGYKTAEDGITKIPYWTQIEEVKQLPSETVHGEVSNFAWQASEPGTTVVPKLQSVSAKARGSANNYSRSNSGGNRSGGGGGKKGGGGSKGSGKLSTKDTRKASEDSRDRYHDVNIQLQQINRNLERTEKQQEKLFGKQLLDNLNKQTTILEQHKQKLKEKNEIQKEDLAEQREALKNLGVIFDQYGNIANYMDILGNKQGNVNALVAQYNQLIERYNNAGSEDAQKAIDEQIKALDKQIKEVEEDLKNTQDKIKNYDSLRQAMEDLMDQIEQETQKQIELNIEKFRMELEIRLDMGQAQRDWNDFKRNVLEHTDLIKDTDFDKIFKDAQQNMADLTSYFEIDGAISSIQKLTEQLMRTGAQINAIDSKGESVIYGDNKAQAMEDLQDDLDQLMSQMKDIEDLIDSIDEAYFDTIDDISDQFDKQIDDYEFIGELIEHDIDLLQLLYGDKNYDAMNQYYTTLQENQNNQLDSLRKQRDYWKTLWDEARQNGEIQAAKQFEENYRNAIKNLNSAIEQGAKTILDKYTNAINKVFDELDKRASNGKGLDYLSTQWDLMNKNAEQYLDTINSAFAVQQLENKFQKALDETNSVKNQKELKKLMDEQLGNLKNKEKLTQYDVDRAEKLLQIEQARIALEQTRANRTTLRLKRDSQGNYSYQYMADDTAILDAQQRLAAAQNDLYNFDKERYQSNLNEILSAWKDFQSQYQEILLDSSLSEEEQLERLTLLRENYEEYINNQVEENLVIRDNLTNSAFDNLAIMYEDDADKYQQMIDSERDALMYDLVPAWGSGVQYMADTIAGQGGLVPVCEQAFNDIDKATKDYEQELHSLANSADLDLNTVKGGIDETASSLNDLIEKNDDLIKRMDDEMTAVGNLKSSVQELKKSYDGVYDSAKNAVSQINDLMKAQQRQAAEEAKKTSTAKAIEDQKKAEQQAAKQKAAEQAAAKQAAAPAPAPQPAPVSTPAPAADPHAYTSPNGRQINDDVARKIAADIWVWNGKGSGWTDDYREKRLTEKIGAYWAGVVKNYVNEGRRNPFYDQYSRSELKKYHYSTFDTGGYTGTWQDNNGRFALLHQKQLVLNKEDTKNILNVVGLVRSVMDSVSGTVYSRLNNIKNGFGSTMNNVNEGIEQNVHIDASFPNVNSKKEIEEAFADLVNLAAQRALKR